MALIKTVKPDEADGKIKESYEEFLKTAGMVPKPFEMFSASPPLFELQKGVIKYFMNHPNLKFALLASIRFAVACAYNFDYCIGLNSEFLKFAGFSDEELEAAKADPGNAKLEEKDKAMLLFVLKALNEPDSVGTNDTDSLHDQGWTDQDIFDAVFHGAGMIGSSKMFKAFKMDLD